MRQLAWNLNWFQLALGFEGLKRFARGIGYWRSVEYPWAIQELELRESDVYLDVGSSSTILPLYVAKKIGCTTHAIDTHDWVLRLLDSARKIGLDKMIRRGNFVTRIADVKKLPYPDNFFDKISCISTIEHVLSEDKLHGDVKALQELERVLKKGGDLAFTVPLGHRTMHLNAKYEEIYTRNDVYDRKYKDKPLFYERRYDLASLRQRISTLPRMEALNITCFGEKTLRIRKHLYNPKLQLIMRLTGPLHPLLAMFFLRHLEPDKHFFHAGLCCIHLRKH